MPGRRSVFYEFGRRSQRLSGRAIALALVLLAVLVATAFGMLLVDPATVVGAALLLLVVVAVASAVEVVAAYEVKALTVFGEFRGLLRPGINVVPPFVSRTERFDLRTETFDVPHQEAITRDNSPVAADAVVYIRVTDAERAFLEVEDYRRAVSNLAQTTLRAVIGDMALDDTLSKRREINDRIRRELEEPTDQWGVRVESVEVRSVRPSDDVTRAMEQQASAERRRRAMILDAQGERRSAVERAEGEKQAAVVRAQGQKQSQILEAQGDAIATVLRARAAESMGERAIVDEGLETLAAIGSSESTTVVVPQELTSLLGRYGRHLVGGDVRTDGEPLASLDFDEATRALLGLDDVDAAVRDVEGPGDGLRRGVSDRARDGAGGSVRSDVATERTDGA